MTHISSLITAINTFRAERNWDLDWEPKNYVISIFTELGEVAEHFQYKNQADLDAYFQDHLTDIGEEICDVLWCVIVLAEALEIDLPQAFVRKMTKNVTEVPLKLKVAERPTVNLDLDFDSLENMTAAILEFRAGMNWTQFSHPRDWLMKMFEEAGELAEFFQWKTNEELRESFKTTLPELSDELIDVLICTLMLFHKLEIKIEPAFMAKIKKNAVKYPLST